LVWGDFIGFNCYILDLQIEKISLSVLSGIVFEESDCYMNQNSPLFIFINLMNCTINKGH
jgi:hypothetical protein